MKANNLLLFFLIFLLTACSGVITPEPTEVFTNTPTNTPIPTNMPTSTPIIITCYINNYVNDEQIEMVGITAQIECDGTIDYNPDLFYLGKTVSTDPVICSGKYVTSSGLVTVTLRNKENANNAKFCEVFWPNGTPTPK